MNQSYILLSNTLRVETPAVGRNVGKHKGKRFIIKVLFIHQVLHKRVVLKNNIKIYIKTDPTCFDAVTPSSGSALIRAY